MKRPALPIPNVTSADDNGSSLPMTEWSGQHLETRAPWNVYCGDARKILPKLAPNRYACVITSPPYFWQRDYGVLGQIGVEQNPGEYVTAICEVMDRVKEVLDPTGVLFLNLGDTITPEKAGPKALIASTTVVASPVLRAVDASGMGLPKKTLLGMPWRVALAMIDRGWILRSSIIWRRENAVPEPNVRDRPWRTYEFIYLFAKSRRYDFNRAALRASGEEDLWTIESQSQAGREHPAVFPPSWWSGALKLAIPRAAPSSIPLPVAGQCSGSP